MRWVTEVSNPSQKVLVLAVIIAGSSTETQENRNICSSQRFNSKRHQLGNENDFGSAKNDVYSGCLTTTRGSTIARDSKFESLQDWSSSITKTSDHVEVRHENFHSEARSSETFTGTSSRHISSMFPHSNGRDRTILSRERNSKELEIQPSWSSMSKTDHRKTNRNYDTKMYTSSRFESCESWTQKPVGSTSFPEGFSKQEGLSSDDNWFRRNEKPSSANPKALSLSNVLNCFDSIEKSFPANPRSQSFFEKQVEMKDKVEYVTSNGHSQMEQRRNFEVVPSLNDHSDQISSIRSQVDVSVSNIGSQSKSILCSSPIPSSEETWSTQLSPS